MPIERLQAPSGGLNTDVAPDYVPATQAPGLTNFLPGPDGRMSIRGSIMYGIDSMTTSTTAPTAFWSHDDYALVKGNPGGGMKTWRIDVATTPLVKTDVTATLVESPMDSRHARYGLYTYGAITDANQPQLGKWDGAASAIVPMANAPFQWTDLQVYANRLFVLGGSVPGTATPSNPWFLYWSDADYNKDLSLLTSWQDDVSGLTNQLLLDIDGEPIALAGCGRFMAILSSRTISILTGTSTSNFAVRSLTKNWGCTNRESVVEVDDGFYFMSDRGLAFCDGATVTLVSDGKVGLELTKYLPDPVMCAAFNHGYLAVYRLGLSGDLDQCRLYNTRTGAWSGLWLDITSTAPAVTYPRAVYRTKNYPVVWQNGGLRRAELATRPGIGIDDNGYGVNTSTRGLWRSRFVRLASPGLKAVVRRVLLDYRYDTGSIAPTDSPFVVTVYDTLGTAIGGGVLGGGAVGTATSDTRSRFVLDINAEADAVQILVTGGAADPTTGDPTVCELFDAWIEFDPAQQRRTI